jgi:hypothetical protein
MGLGACTGDVAPSPFFGSEAALEVVSATMTGTIDGREISEVSYLDATGSRVGDDGFFHIQSATGSFDVSACPLGEGRAAVDPYGGGGGGGRGEPMMIPGGNGEVGAVDCFSRGLNVCDAGGSCVGFEASEVTLEVRDLGPRRALDLEAHSDRGDVHVELRYYER